MTAMTQEVLPLLLAEREAVLIPWQRAPREAVRLYQSAGMHHAAKVLAGKWGLSVAPGEGCRAR